MDPKQAEIVYAGAIVLVLFGLAGFYGWRQLQTLRQLPGNPDLDADDRRYHHSQAWRRLICCVLMGLLASMMVGYYALGIHERGARVRPAAIDDPAAKQAAEDARQNYISLLSVYWLTATGLIVAILFLAMFDLMAIRRYGLRHMRRLQSDHRAMLEQQVAAMRSQRNGHEEH
ncbi:MAG: hypothetical protein AB7K24_17360 [Gemmataceae bacterium]